MGTNNRMELTVFFLHRQRWRLFTAVTEKIGTSRFNQTLMFGLHGIEHHVAEIVMFKGQHVHTLSSKEASTTTTMPKMNGKIDRNHVTEPMK